MLLHAPGAPQTSVAPQDRQWMLDSIRNVTKSVFMVRFDEVMKHLDMDGDGKACSSVASIVVFPHAFVGCRNCGVHPA